jgi:hypothetical protein
MTPLESAIQATANACTAHGFVQALEQAAGNMRNRAQALRVAIVATEEPEDRTREKVADELEDAASLLDQEVARRKPEVDRMQQLATQAAAVAVQSQADGAKVRQAVALLLGL